MPGVRLVLWFASALALLMGVEPVAADWELRRLGQEHYFNLEYDQAIDAFEKQIEADANDPLSHNDLATAVLYKEVHRLGLLLSRVFKSDNEFLRQQKPEPDPSVKVRFEGAILKGRALAESILEERPRDRDALYALSQNYALEANFEFLLEKSYFSALRNAGRGRKYGDMLIEAHPDFVDGYLVSGVSEYAIGSLPWAVRMLVALGGVRGDKEKGQRYVTRVAEEGELARDAARALLAVLLRREEQPLEAVRVLEGLLKDYPRNYVMQIEMGAMFEDAGELEKALKTYRSVLDRAAAGEYSLMPKRLREAVQRKVEELEGELANGSPNAPVTGVSRAA